MSEFMFHAHRNCAYNVLIGSVLGVLGHDSLICVHSSLAEVTLEESDAYRRFIEAVN